jgi:peptide/nickel transport system substrate-binding protein
MSWKQDLYQIWHSSQADVPESSNAIGYKNPELDKLIDEMRVTFNSARQVELYHKMHQILFDDQPYAFLFVDKQTAGHQARIQNVKFYRIRPCLDEAEWFAPAGEMRK